MTTVKENSVLKLGYSTITKTKENTAQATEQKPPN